jgi:hypothetical protein
LNNANFQNYALPLVRRVFPGGPESKPSPFNKTRESKLGIKLDGLCGWKVEPKQEQNKIILKIEKADIVGLFAHKVVGVQALSSPVGLAYAMRYTYNNDGTSGTPTSGTGQ